ncbi:hypothetical protein KFL_005190040 [Klebsormidium nitens]|uniref:Uncharacterized protein n=1 Tax=Klebsormidium nitens TaxID=105231 RepID=A0A1Y1IH69_KLENI|nr:hypothetical protein KFL_005190040 [Klebsormidium nitens]|eukprot:GAQ89412.1 hypothetical protein KFL_005190040 [Klebsormidium nitens]
MHGEKILTRELNSSFKDLIRGPKLITEQEGIVKQRRHRSGLVLCSRRGYEVAIKLLAAKKKRALYATKLLIETPLMGLCALTLVTVWAHWGPAARATGAPIDVYALTTDLLIRGDIEQHELYAIIPAWTGVLVLFSRCIEDLCELGIAARKCCKLRKKLPSEITEPTLDWDSDDEMNLELERGVLQPFATDAVKVEAFLLSTWAAWNFIFPPTSDYDICCSNVYLCSLPVALISYVVQEACTSLALVETKRAAQDQAT